MNTNSQDNRSLGNKARNLSDLFYEIEGRRPRILVGGSEVADSQGFKEMSSLFADLGCDVDLSPKILHLNALVRQSQENDADIILVCIKQEVIEEELLQLSTAIQTQQPDTVLVLHTLQDAHISHLSQNLSNWIMYGADSNKTEKGFEILSRLLDGYKSDET